MRSLLTLIRGVTMLGGYVRVSISDQNSNLRIFTDKASGAKADRLRLDKMFNFICK